ncbi:MAG: fluoride efflux transporter CrcB [Halobacteriovoraceae bacterium]|nr:fluoride efflux transporter CrcB [Halobacteriovoraceae bacterium]
MSISLLSITTVFVGGGAGALLRWFLTSVVNSQLKIFWTGTLFVNLLGSFIFFLLSKIELPTSLINLNLALKTGLLGSLTTFSTFSFEIITLFRDGKVLEGLLVALLNFLFSILLGVLIFKDDIFI